ncbi:chorismate-binding protein [Halobacteriovorax sp.]|uniref:chorismate-binding protein n=1 Tax=Halobacteriovorax sp. TaxID=2020862 RepID=UPI003566E3ED
MWSVFWLGDKFVKYTRPSFARLFFLNHSIDLLSGDSSEISIDDFIRRMEESKPNLDSIRSQNKYVSHLFYELGEIFSDTSTPDEALPLAIEIEYTESCDWEPIQGVPSLDVIPVSAVSKVAYQESFEKGFKHLTRGDCYQFNLTFPFSYRWERSLSAEEICSKLWTKIESRSPYAHGTYIPAIDKLFLSNSPECLFQGSLKKGESKVWSMPIKGTLERGKDWRKSWKLLKASRKDQGELNMITDLLRNDLTRIDLQASRVVRKCAPLLVPGIIHQYSVIETRLREETSLLSILSAMFPGGSITGAPKKNVMKILKKIESVPRGFYCGSTVLLDNDIFAASINIRSAEIDLKSRMMHYHAGGGITLLSKVDEEYLEMCLKKDSFVRNL